MFEKTQNSKKCFKMGTRHFKIISEIISPEALLFPDIHQFFVFLSTFVKKKMARYPLLCTQLKRKTSVTRVFHATLKC